MPSRELVALEDVLYLLRGAAEDLRTNRDGLMTEADEHMAATIRPPQHWGGVAVDIVADALVESATEGRLPVYSKGYSLADVINIVGWIRDSIDEAQQDLLSHFKPEDQDLAAEDIDLILTGIDLVANRFPTFAIEWDVLNGMLDQKAKELGCELSLEQTQAVITAWEEQRATAATAG